MKLENLFLDSVKAREFNRGQSAKIFKQVEETKKPIKVIKNSKEYMVIMEYEQYLNMLAIMNNGGLNEKI